MSKMQHFIILLLLPFSAQAMQNTQSSPDTLMPDVEYHTELPEVTYFTKYYSNTVINIIQTQNCDVRRIIKRTNNHPPTAIFLGVLRPTQNSIQVLDPTDSALFFHVFSARYHLLHRTPEEWLALANTH